jgi:ppGpp synthetase/RelA/SpoT-type nucleotidyltranferase
MAKKKKAKLQDQGQPDMSVANDRLVSEFTAIRPTFEAFTSNIESLIKTLLRSRSIDYLAVEPRTKTVESFTHKAQRPDKLGKYAKFSQMTDLSGIRIIAYYLKDLSLICDLIEANFEIDRQNSTDKNGSLAPDRFGYLSIHYIVSPQQGSRKASRKRGIFWS